MCRLEEGGFSLLTASIQLEIRAASPPPLPHGPSNHATPTVARQPDNAGATGCGVRVREFVFCLYAFKIRSSETAAEEMPFFGAKTFRQTSFCDYFAQSQM